MLNPGEYLEQRGEKWMKPRGRLVFGVKVRAYRGITS